MSHFTELWISCKAKWIVTAIPISEYIFFFWILSDLPSLVQKGLETVYILKGLWCSLRSGTVYQIHATFTEPFRMTMRTFSKFNHLVISHQILKSPTFHWHDLIIDLPPKVKLIYCSQQHGCDDTAQIFKRSQLDCLYKNLPLSDKTCNSLHGN